MDSFLAFEKESARVLHLSILLSRKSPSFYSSKERPRPESRQETGPPFCLCSAVLIQDFLRGETAQTTQAEGVRAASFCIALISLGGPPGCDLSAFHKKHGDPDAPILINKWYPKPSDVTL